MKLRRSKHFWSVCPSFCNVTCISDVFVELKYFKFIIKKHQLKMKIKYRDCYEIWRLWAARRFALKYRESLVLHKKIMQFTKLLHSHSHKVLFSQKLPVVFLLFLFLFRSEIKFD